MAFLRTVVPLKTSLILNDEGLYMRVPQMADFQKWRDVRMESHRFLQPWEPSWPSDDLTKSAYRKRVKSCHMDLADGTGTPFFIFDAESDDLLGGINITNIRKGVIQSCTLGYWVGEKHAKKGVMTKAILRLIPYIFKTLKLHRIEAACLPDNEASIRLLEKTGFQYEGLARNYLYINGRWQDHKLYALLRSDIYSEPL
jgi:ribosomal-protein-alanine N-acetyltransferase